MKGAGGVGDHDDEDLHDVTLDVAVDGFVLYALEGVALLHALRRCVKSLDGRMAPRLCSSTAVLGAAAGQCSRVIGSPAVPSCGWASPRGRGRWQ
eukprot:3556318-Pyramimonas_sp.AAC.1